VKYLQTDHSVDDEHYDERPTSTHKTPKSIILKSCKRCPVVSGYDSQTSIPPTPGLYSVVFNVTQNTSVRLFASTFANAIQLSHLPFIPRIRAKVIPGKKNLTAIILNWKRNPSFVNGQEMSLSYCVSINSWGHFEALCFAQAKLRIEMPTRRMSPLSSSLQLEDMQNTVRAEPSSQSVSYFTRDVQTVGKLTCVSSRSRYRFRGEFHEGQRYYFDLLVIDNITLTSVAYVGTSLRVPVREKNLLILTDEKFSRTIHLQKNKVKRIKFYVNETGQSLEMSVQVCVGRALVQISFNGNNLSNFTVDHPMTKRLRFKSRIGVYTVSVWRHSKNTTAQMDPNTSLNSSSLGNATAVDQSLNVSCSTVRRRSREMIVLIQLMVRDRVMSSPNISNRNLPEIA